MYLPVLKYIAIVTHIIHVSSIYLHLVDFDGKCGYINIPYMDLMGNGDASRNYIHKWWIFPPLNVRPVAFDLVKNARLFLERMGRKLGAPTWRIIPGRNVSVSLIYKPWSSAIWKGNHNPTERTKPNHGY